MIEPVDGFSEIHMLADEASTCVISNVTLTLNDHVSDRMSELEHTYLKGGVAWADHQTAALRLMRSSADQSNSLTMMEQFQLSPISCRGRTTIGSPVTGNSLLLEHKASDLLSVISANLIFRFERLHGIMIVFVLLACGVVCAHSQSSGER